MAVGARIREIRERSGMTQQEFAAAAGMDRNFAGRLERGLQNLSLLSIGRASLALGVAPSEFFEGIRADRTLLGPVRSRSTRPAKPPAGVE